jgi:hypothetical protein
MIYLIVTLVVLFLILAAAGKQQAKQSQQKKSPMEVSIPHPDKGDQGELFYFLADLDSENARKVKKQFKELGVTSKLTYSVLDSIALNGYLFVEEFAGKFSNHKFALNYYDLGNFQETIEFTAKGVHIPERIPFLKRLVHYTKLELVPEPDNPYDPNAIKILDTHFNLIGYVPSEMTWEIQLFIDDDHHAFAKHVERVGYFDLEVIVYHEPKDDLEE